MTENLTWHRTDFQSVFSEASLEDQENRDKNQSSKLKKRSDFWFNTQNSNHDNASNSALQNRAIITWTKE